MELIDVGRYNEIICLTVDESLHPIVLLLGFERHKVHAALPGNQSIDVFNDNDSNIPT